MSKPRITFVLIAAVGLGTMGPSARAGEDWPRFRGPHGSGVSDGSGPPERIEPAAAAWTREVPFGRSSPIVVGGSVVITAAGDDRLITTAYDAATGEPRWSRAEARLRRDDVSSESGPAVATPVSDGRRIVAFFPELGLIAYDLEGNVLWRRELPPFDSYYGMGSSPVIEGGTVVMLLDQQRGPYILGVDVETGEVRWRADRAVPAESWTTPVVRRPGTDAAEVLVFGSTTVDAYSPHTGEHRWSLGGVGFTPVASPVLMGERLFVVAPDQLAEASAPSEATMFALDRDGDGELAEAEMAPSDWSSFFRWLDMDGDGRMSRSEYATQVAGLGSKDNGLVAIDLAGPGAPRVAWRETRSLPYVASPIVAGGALFVVKDGGILTSFDPGTGRIVRRGRIEGAIDAFFPSPVASGDRLILASSSGSLAVVTARGEWEVLSVTDFDEPIYASPAIADGRLFLRTRSRLYAFTGDGPDREGRSPIRP